MKPRRRCSECGRRRVGAYFLADADGRTFRGAPNPMSANSSSDPRWWPRFLGWLCREHSTLEHLAKTYSFKEDGA